MDLLSLKQDIDQLVEELLAKTPHFSAEKFGLDSRAVYGDLWRGEDFIACELSELGRLEYYGGFEYEKEHRTIISNYVFWSTESERVAGHWEQAE